MKIHIKCSDLRTLFFFSIITSVIVIILFSQCYFYTLCTLLIALLLKCKLNMQPRKVKEYHSIVFLLL